MKQCRSTRALRARHFRPIVCRFCHKMGTSSGTHLLFQSDDSGTNDANAVLQGNNGGGFTALSVDDILYDPAGNLGSSAISNGQVWY